MLLASADFSSCLLTSQSMKIWHKILRRTSFANQSVSQKNTKKASKIHLIVNLVFRVTTLVLVL